MVTWINMSPTLEEATIVFEQRIEQRIAMMKEEDMVIEEVYREVY